LDTLIGPVWLSPAEHAELEPLLIWLEREAPPGPLWVPTDQPLYYALAGRSDVTGYASLDSYLTSSREQDRLLERLRSEPPAVALVRPSLEFDTPLEELEASASGVHAYLSEHYREVRQFGLTRAFLRREAGRDQSSNK
ncbi:MAG: hypothetical protein CL928_13210, partial [Deltaproteobacteria bacterium]|nr:hypothetical protein [Deltaproteobacteria bacterium]